MWLFHDDDPSRSFRIAKSRRQPPPAIAPATIRQPDESEGMLAAQLAATHGAAMECFRLGLNPEHTFDGRRESLSQASELVRSCALLAEALQRCRPQARQEP